MSKRKAKFEGVKVEETYNPLDKRHLGESVATALLDRPVHPLKPEQFLGSGVYAIYYTGPFEPYARLSKLNRDKEPLWPLYVGKAVPSGARKGGQVDAPQADELWQRIKEHYQSIEQAENLDPADFCCRYLVVDDIWIPLGESLMIQKFSPVWNQVVDGFGNHAPGGGRSGQKRSPWDTLHPGRPWAKKLSGDAKSRETILEEIDDHITHLLKSIPADER